MKQKLETKKRRGDKVMSKKFYITTPIYYPNAKPHVGTAYTTIVADVVARYMRLKDYDVSFLTGVDEHGQKIQEAAERNMLTPQEWVDKMALNFTTLWKKLNISNTDFMRTTEERHKISVKKMIKKVYENGDIYKGEYEGLYCVSDEAFIPDNSVVDGNKCPHCGKDLNNGMCECDEAKIDPRLEALKNLFT